MSEDLHHKSIWIATSEQKGRPKLSHDAQADVCVIGAGIAGLTTAYLLAQEGKSVIVLESGSLTSGQTARTSAHLMSALDDRYFEVEKVHGAEVTKLAASAHAGAIDRVESIVRKEQIDCDFRRLNGYLFVPPDQSQDILDKEFAAVERAAVIDVELVGRAPLTTFDTGRCLRFAHQGQFHPLKYIAGLAEAIERHGGRIYCDTHVTKAEGGDNARVHTREGGVVKAQSIVVATNVPINDLLILHTKQAPYTTYTITSQVPSGSVEQALYWDTQDPYHYVRIEPGEDGMDHLLIGGEDHKSGQATDQAERWSRLEHWGRERFPMMSGIEYYWSGQVMETIDGLAFIGRNPMDKDNVYVATGDSGMGMTHGTIAGILITDLITGRENPWTRIFDPARKPVWGMAWKEFLSENANVGAQYVKDWLSGSDVSSLDKIARGSGAVMRDGLSKVAFYRDDKGAIHRCSAVCPHLGCIVHWNDGAHTWDCPCHGSLFDPYGAVLNGPANKPLEKLG